MRLQNRIDQERASAIQAMITGFMQLLAAVGAGLLLGDTWPHCAGITLAIYALMPTVSSNG